MPKVTWDVEIDGQTHQVQLAHGYWSGRRCVFFDGQQVFASRRVFDAGSLEGFRFNGHTLVISIQAHLATFTYDLFLDGLSVATGEEAYVSGAKMYTPAFAESAVMAEAAMSPPNQPAVFWRRLQQVGFLLVILGAPLLAGQFGRSFQLPGCFALILGLIAILQPFRHRFE